MMRNARQTGRGPLRRELVFGFAASVLILPGVGLAASVATPSATEGPFYPDRLPLDDDNDLISVRGRDARAAGTPFDLSGRILTLSGNPLPGAGIEIWQCDANGVYLHSADSARRDYDRNFQGFGRTVAGSDGGYRFRTIVPVPYSVRTPHIHMKIVAPNRRELVTQIYIDGYRDNEDDFLFRRLGGEAARKAASVVLERSAAASPDGARGRFDIILR